MNPPDPRRIDHLVMPTADLDVARRRLEHLGFTVAPVGVHPFGTRNCCVFFADCTYLEPLAIGDEARAKEAIAAGNGFVALDAKFRERNGNEGFSALVLASDDAAADRRRFVSSGISNGNLLDFSREFVDPAGRAETASFRLAFAGKRTGEGFLFCCQRINVPSVSRGELEIHANGASRIRRIIAVTGAPGASARLIAEVAEANVTLSDAGLLVALPNGDVEVLARPVLAQTHGIDIEGAGLGFAAIVFGVTELAAVERLLRTNGVKAERRERQVIVPPAAGQGATFIFEDMR